MNHKDLNPATHRPAPRSAPVRARAGLARHEREQLLRREQMARAEAEMMADISRRISSSLDLDQVLQAIVESTQRLVDADMSHIKLLDANGELRTAAIIGNRTQAFADRVLPAGAGLGGRVLASGQPCQSDDYLADTRVVRDTGADRAVSDEGIVSALVAPIQRGEETVGVLFVSSRRRRHFAAGEVALLERLSSQAATALANAQAYAREQAARAELADRTRALEAKTAEQDAFIYTVSHDLKAPLVSIQGMAELLEQDASPRLLDDDRFYISRIVENARRLAALLEDLLTLSRVGRADTEPLTVELGSVVESAREHLLVQVARRDAKICVAAPLPPARGNPVRLEEVFTNLIDNAIKYTPQDRRPEIEIGARAAGDLVECWIDDNGVGIEPEQRERVFGLFQRLADGKRLHAAGTGVGLAIVARIVQVHGGRVWIEPSAAGGSSFHFTLPAASEAAGSGLAPAGRAPLIAQRPLEWV